MEASWWGIAFHHLHAGYLLGASEEIALTESLGEEVMKGFFPDRANKSW